MTPDNRSLDRLNQLMSQLLDGALSDQEAVELNGLVDSNPVFQAVVVDQWVLDTLLIEELGTESMTALVDFVDPAPPYPALRAWSLWHYKRGRILSALAVILLVALMAGVFFSGASQASARTWIAESRRIHQLALDRCYVVESNIDSDIKKRTSALARAVGRIDRLWTRGDQFYIESSNDRHRWVWGMDATRSVWLTFNSKLGLRLEANELPAWMETLTDALSMRMDTLLDEVLSDFELSWEPSTNSSTTRIVKASSPRNRLIRIREVRLEIDRETKVVQKIAIVRLNRSDVLTTTTFTLAATEAQPDSRYNIEGHLEERSIILSSKNQPERRSELINRLFGQ